MGPSKFIKNPSNKEKWDPWHFLGLKLSKIFEKLGVQVGDNLWRLVCKDLGLVWVCFQLEFGTKNFLFLELFFLVQLFLLGSAWIVFKSEKFESLQLATWNGVGPTMGVQHLEETMLGRACLLCNIFFLWIFLSFSSFLLYLLASKTSSNPSFLDL